MSVGAGTSIGSSVRLIEPIGEGAMGRVWLGEHTSLNIRVAVKLLHDRTATEDPGALDRFVREGRTLARVKSPHVVQVLDQGTTDEGERYVVMELLEGESLEARLERKKRLTVRQAAVVITGVARALAAAHRVGVVHRDVKPGNIFLAQTTEGPLVKVVDFGIARLADQQDRRAITIDGAVLGTPAYMCPDQLNEQIPANERTDMWALAVVAYECLTGKLPFDGPNVAMTFAAIATGEFEPPSAIHDELSQEVDCWFERAFHRDPELRFSSVTELALTLLPLLPVPVKDLEQQLRGVPAAFSLPPPSDGSVSDDAPSTEAPQDRTMVDRRAPVHAGTLAGSATSSSGPNKSLGRRTLVLAGSLGAALVLIVLAVWAPREHHPSSDEATGRSAPSDPHPASGDAANGDATAVTPEPALEDRPARVEPDEGAALAASSRASPTAAPSAAPSATLVAPALPGPLHPQGAPPRPADFPASSSPSSSPASPAKTTTTSPPDPTSPDVLGF
jgi:serine/threonine-protein kinase